MARPRFFFDNRLSDATPAASSTAVGEFAVANLLDWRPYTWWKAAAIPATVTVDSGSAKARDFLLVYGEPGTYEARGSTDNFAASNVLLATAVITQPRLKLIEFASASHRYTRLTIPSGAAPAVAIAVIGAALEVPANFQRSFDPIGRLVHGHVNLNEAGHPLGSIVDFEEWRAHLMFTLLERTWIRDNFVPAWKTHLRGTPSGFVWDADHPEDVRLLRPITEFEAPHYHAQAADLVLPVAGLIE